MTDGSTWLYCVGGGASSLMLAAALSKYPVLPGPLRIAERKANLGQAQSFGFWVDRPHSLDHLIKARWSRWQFSRQNTESTVHIGERQSYVLIEGADFFDWAALCIESHPQMSLHLNVEITAPPKATHVVDSRPPSLSEFKTYQTFAGIEIEETHPPDPSMVDLMTCMHCDADSLLFLYRLPKPNGCTLIEWTAFGGRPFDMEKLVRMTQESAPSGRIVREERGIIPMGVHQLSSWGTPIGARGQMTRAASGYGFKAMWDWAERAAKQLIEHNEMPSHPIYPAWVGWMDQCLIQIIQSAPHALAGIFSTLAQRLSGDQFADFMMKPTTRNALQMMQAAPKRPFVYSAVGCARWI